MPSSKILVIILVCLITIFTVWGDSFLKKAGNHVNIFLNKDFVVGFLVYASTAFLWVFVYKSTKFSISGVIYSILSMLVFVAIGVGMFGEKLSWVEVLGLFMAASSFIILGRFI